jgi:Fur family zinc uptake transcriptional regulator
MPRVQVIRALSDSEVALSAYAIHEKIVAAGGKIDVVSVYRILNTLEEVGLIHHIGIVDGYFPARTTSPDATASELLVDADSGEVRELEIPPSILAAIQSQSKDKGFEVTTIKLELLGRVA